MEAYMVFWIATAVVVLLLDVWVIYSVSRSTKSAGTKAGWALLILALPVIGAAIWGVSGPRGVVEPPTSNEHSKG
ncbi:PLDc_N domain-containing protein [Pseudomonas sp. CDFA 602]|uniref:PLD nuclease N-terminal domain-containing protein n=1 Tax=Pseudomonas californiensis TaxID=2829823 RepID=UPI001E476FA7|nr:PLD nuclease N-terminal domain-containing protein [Pseudomonas californiensis]MCD5996109.1 PLDc_N domain-containing protein [Pseudomonas californiensis]MCD6001708.1 PLDc_N domain-containing protein [Pseudomonas californiensis]